MFYKLIALIVSRPMIFKFLLNRAKKTPYSHIYGAKEELYMERYWLFNPHYPVEGRSSFRWLPIAMRIHKIVKEDGDKHLHDHPWNARTFILKGWYKEERIGDDFASDYWGDIVTFKRKAGDTARLNFGEYHRITEVCDEGVYTIFVTGKYRGAWGFLVEGVKVKYREYLKKAFS